MLAGIKIINLTAKTKWELFSSRSLIAAQAGMNALGATFLVGMLTLFISYLIEPGVAWQNTLVITILWSVFASPLIIMYCAADDWVSLGELHKKLNTPTKDKTD